MKRDLELIRTLLLEIESKSPQMEVRPSTDEERYNLKLAIEAGLVEGNVSGEIGVRVPQVIAYDLTWTGHDFLGAARSDTIWKKAMSKIAAAGGSWTLEIVKQVLLATVRSDLGLPGT